MFAMKPALAAVAAGAILTLGSGIATAEPTPPTAADIDATSSGSAGPWSGSTTLSQAGQATGSGNAVAVAVYPASPALASLICLFSGSGSTYVPPGGGIGVGPNGGCGSEGF